MRTEEVVVFCSVASKANHAAKEERSCMQCMLVLCLPRTAKENGAGIDLEGQPSIDPVQRLAVPPSLPGGPQMPVALLLSVPVHFYCRRIFFCAAVASFGLVDRGLWPAEQ